MPTLPSRWPYRVLVYCEGGRRMEMEIAGLPTALKLTHSTWPEETAEQPGDPRFETPDGFVLGAPAEVFPYRGAPNDSYYGPERSRGSPIDAAPLQAASGGTVYFSRRVPDELQALLRMMEVREHSREFAAFPHVARDPQQERYLVQLKLVTFSAVKQLYQLSNVEMPPTQELTIAEALEAFVHAQAEYWLEPGRVFSHRLAGTAGGDGDWAKEDLAFGLHVENAFWGVYRIWSRSWLVTK